MEVLNEQGVLVMFARDAEAAGFEIVRVQNAFPDMLVRRSGIEYRVELEYRASNFRHHGHDPRGCDLIICWENDYPDSVLPVLALSEPDWFKTDLTLPAAIDRELAYWKQRATKAERQIRSLRYAMQEEPVAPVPTSALAGASALTTDPGLVQELVALLRHLLIRPTDSQSQIANALGRPKSTVGGWLRKLDEVGVIDRSTDQINVLVNPDEWGRH